MNSVLAGLVGLGLLAVGANHASAPATISSPAPAPVAIATASAAPAAGVSVATVAPPADLEGDDAGDYMKNMSSAELTKLYAQHDAEVARLMAEAPDDPMVIDASLVDPLTGEEASIDAVAF